jgi:hypothetical protein
MVNLSQFQTIMGRWSRKIRSQPIEPTSYTVEIYLLGVGVDRMAVDRGNFIEFEIIFGEQELTIHRGHGTLCTVRHNASNG